MATHSVVSTSNKQSRNTLVQWKNANQKYLYEEDIEDNINEQSLCLQLLEENTNLYYDWVKEVVETLPDVDLQIDGDMREVVSDFLYSNPVFKDLIRNTVKLFYRSNR